MKGIHTILGAGGAIGSNLVPVLLKHGEQVRLVSRSGKTHDGCESRKADVLNKASVLKAIEGSAVVYLLVGIEYKSSIWQQNWPIIMRNVLDACMETKTKLIFFDNVYMYGRVQGKMTEETPFKPISKKGAVRAEIASMFLADVKAGKIQALIARSADFYGPYAEGMSFYHQLMLKNQRAGKGGQWMVNAQVPHSMTYTPDAAAALYALAGDESAFGQTWHLPTAEPALSGEELAALGASFTNGKAKVSVLSNFMIRLAGIFVPVIRESIEMLYQYDSPYFFDSSKFEKHFGWKATSYHDGIRDTVKFYQS